MADLESLGAAAVLETLQLFTISASNDSDDDVRSVLAGMGSRAINHLQELARITRLNGLSTELRWKPRTTEEISTAWTPMSASRLNDVISHSQIAEEEQVLVGHLGTVSDFRDYFELVTADGVVRGRVAEDVRRYLRTYFGEDITATLRVRTVTSTTSGQQRFSYILIGLASSPDRSLLDSPDEPEEERGR